MDPYSVRPEQGIEDYFLCGSSVLKATDDGRIQVAAFVGDPELAAQHLVETINLGCIRINGRPVQLPSEPIEIGVKLGVAKARGLS